MKTRMIKQLVFAIVAVVMLLPVKGWSATLKIEDFTIKPGETKEMLVDVNNADMQVTMVEFYMYLPTGLSVATENGDLAVDIAGRTTWKKHSLEAKMDGGALHVFLYSGSNATLSGTSGAVISVKLTASSSFSGGNIILKNQVITAPDEKESKPADYTYKVTTGVSDAVTITAHSYTRQYGEANPTFGYTVTSGSITSGTPTITCSATKTSPVGTYPIVISKGSVSNGDVTLVNGTLTITKAPLTISAGNYTKVEGEANPTFTPTFSGFKNNETKSVLTKQPTVTTTATTSSPAGTYPVTVSGAEAQNYSMTYVNGTLTVTAKPVVSDNIIFADAEVKRICVENWDTNGDGELSKAEAAAVTDLGQVFKENKTITSFNELQYFTGVTSIDRTFYYCSSLVTVTIPNSVTSIKYHAFFGCSSLLSITIPNSVTSIESAAFGELNSLSSIKVESGNTVYDSRNNCNAIIHTNTNELILGCKNTNIPNSVISIGIYAFYGCSGLTSIIIPNSVTSIVASAFGRCGLTSVTIPSSVTKIGGNVFTGCNNLSSIKVESGNTIYDSRNNCNAIINTTTNMLILGCKNTVIPNSVTSIAGRAFDCCSGLTSIIIPNSVTSIGECAFMYCSGLTSVTIPNSVTSIGNSAFSYCTGLSSVTIPNSLMSIGNSAFSYCSGLTSVTIPNSVTSIGNNAFLCCSGLTSITIPNRVTSIGVQAFYYCSGLTSVTIGNSVTSIGKSAFYRCSGLTSITIGNSVTSIGVQAFYYCSGLTSITIPNRVKSLGDRAFYGCSGLTSVTIPNSVTSIGDESFFGCIGLTEVRSMIEQPFVIKDNVFQYYDNGYKFTSATLYVPNGTKSLYQATDGWKNFTNIVEMEPEGELEGDLNHDGKVDVADMVRLMEIIAGKGK